MNILLTFILGTMGAVSSYIGIRAYNTKKLIQDLPTSKIRSVAVGISEIKGKTTPLTTILKSPFTKQDCVHYHYTIEEFKQQGKTKKWVIILQEKSTTPFLVQDDSGTMQVNPKNAEIDIPQNVQYKSGLGKDPPKEIQEFIKNHNKQTTELTTATTGIVAGFVNNIFKLSFEGLFGINKTMRYTEYLIKPNTEVYILGQACIPTTAQTSPPQTPLTQNSPKQTTPTKATQKLQLQFQKGTPFIISNKKEENMTKKYSIETAIFMTIAVLLFAGALYFLFQ